jgi:hypothetical protein
MAKKRCRRKDGRYKKCPKRKSSSSRRKTPKKCRFTPASPKGIFKKASCMYKANGYRGKWQSYIKKAAAEYRRVKG